MRSVVLGLGISIDGYIARLDGGVDFLFMPKDDSMADFFSSIDTAIMGRKTYDKSREMGGGSYGPSLKTYVFSRSLPPGERDGLIFVNHDLDSFISELRKYAGKDVWLMGEAN
jgi:dihydrofolate reductase